ncbi:MAG: hypothetical protein RL240_4172 [Planctomycetota bacterium]|jgi:hypothetical protein
MSTLIDRCRELITQCTRLKTVNADAELSQQIETLEAKAARLADMSREALRNLSTLLEGGLLDETLKSISAKLGGFDDRLAKVLGKARDAPGKLKDDQTWATFERLAQDLERDLTAILRTQWRGFVDGRTQNRSEVFSAFRGLTQCRDAVDKLIQKENLAKSRRDQLPASDTDIKFIIEIGDSMTALINGLGIDGEPKEMIDFLKLCASGDGVCLSALTDERLEWLRAKGFGESLRIKG